MEKVTFKEFCTRRGFGPKRHQKSFVSLGAIIGVHNSYISRLYNEPNTIEKDGDAFRTVIDYMAQHGYELDYIPKDQAPKEEKPKEEKKSVFDTFLQKEYNKLNARYESLYERHKELEKKYKALEIAYANTISEEEINKLKEENKIMKDHLKHLKELFDFINLVGGDL